MPYIILYIIVLITLYQFFYIFIYSDSQADVLNIKNILFKCQLFIENY